MQALADTPLDLGSGCAKREASNDKEKPAVCESPTMSESTADDEMDLESVSDLESEWAKALTEGSSQLPVERTFIQFNTRPHVHRRRSKSV
mmetsp:Transcript_32466/g.75814  ORF Transcript_32466/g.75814 Transcript_32466/m.75814 type:complete len:91 (-) Transcript_32466:177-449(-)